MPSYIFKCNKCGKISEEFCSISERNNIVECDCGGESKRDWEAEFAPGQTMTKLVTENERWSLSMGVPASQVEVFRKRFPNSVYDNNGRLLIKDRKDKLRQMKERGFVEWGVNDTPWK